MALNKLKTGVPGLDEILKGGVRENSNVLISGGPGSGKSILVMQFLAEGAKNGEPGLCILYDADKEGYLQYADSLGIELRKYEQKGLLTFLVQPMLIKRIATLAVPLDLIRNKKIKRVVLDSLTMFAYVHVSEDKDYRKKIIDFLANLRGVTLFSTVEASGSNIDEINFKAEDFLFDGVIFLTKVRQEATFERVLHVSKMKGQEHLMNIFPFTIGKGGIKVYPDQLPFALMAQESIRISSKN